MKQGDHESRCLNGARNNAKKGGTFANRIDDLVLQGYEGKHLNINLSFCLLALSGTD